MTCTVLAVFAALIAVSPALAQKDETVEKRASEEEAKRVRDVISQIGCEAAQIEKESDNLFEIDDATCKIGQYDIKLNADYKIVSMTLDE